MENVYGIITKYNGKIKERILQEINGIIDVKELAEMIVDAATQDKYTGIINVCSGNPISLGEKVEQFLKEKKIDIELKYGAFPDREYDSPVVYGDATKIQDIEKMKYERK